MQIDVSPVDRGRVAVAVAISLSRRVAPPPYAAGLNFSFSATMIRR